MKLAYGYRIPKYYVDTEGWRHEDTANAEIGCVSVDPADAHEWLLSHMQPPLGGVRDGDSPSLSGLKAYMRRLSKKSKYPRIEIGLDR